VQNEGFAGGVEYEDIVVVVAGAGAIELVPLALDVATEIEGALSGGFL